MSRSQVKSRLDNLEASANRAAWGALNSFLKDHARYPQDPDKANICQCSLCKQGRVALTLQKDWERQHTAFLQTTNQPGDGALKQGD